VIPEKVFFALVAAMLIYAFMPVALCLCALSPLAYPKKKKPEGEKDKKTKSPDKDKKIPRGKREILLKINNL
jgi:hypothetical protein